MQAILTELIETLRPELEDSAQVSIAQKSIDGQIKTDPLYEPLCSSCAPLLEALIDCPIGKFFDAACFQNAGKITYHQTLIPQELFLVVQGPLEFRSLQIIRTITNQYLPQIREAAHSLLPANS